MVKEHDVMCHGLGSLPMLIGMLQDLVARDDAALHFIEDDVPPKLNQGTAFVARDGAGVRLEEAEHLLLRCDLLAFEHSATCLSNHPLDQRQHILCLGQQTLGLRLGLLVERASPRV